MSFWDDLGDIAGKALEVVSAPVWVPFDASAKLLRDTFPKNDYAKIAADTFSAPGALVHGGKLSLSKAEAVFNKAAPGLKLAAGAAGGSIGSAVGFDGNGLSLASGILDDVTAKSGAKYNQERGTIANEAGAKPTPFIAPQQDSLLVPALVIGGAALLAVVIFGRK